VEGIERDPTGRTIFRTWTVSARATQDWFRLTWKNTKYLKKASADRLRTIAVATAQKRSRGPRPAPDQQPAAVVHQRDAEHQQDEPGVPPAVEDVAGQQQQRVAAQGDAPPVRPAALPSQGKM